MDGRKWNAGQESAEAEKAGASTLTTKKRQFHMAIDAELQEGYDSSDSVERVAKSSRVVVYSSDSDEDSENQTEEAICECCEESGYLADCESEEPQKRYYTSVVTQEPHKRRMEDKSENAAKA